MVNLPCWAYKGPNLLFFAFPSCMPPSSLILQLLTLKSGRYGPAPRNSDSAINILLDVVTDQSGKTYKMDHFAARYPTNIVDIANFLVRLSGIQPDYDAETANSARYSAATAYSFYSTLFSS